MPKLTKKQWAILARAEETERREAKAARYQKQMDALRLKIRNDPDISSTYDTGNFWAKRVDDDWIKG